MASEGVGTVDLDTIVNLDDLERAAERVMDKQDFDYFAGGALPSPATPASSVTARARPGVPSRSSPPPSNAPPRSEPSRAGAETETTLRANAAAYASVRLWPRCLVDVSDVDTRCAVPSLGLRHLAAPLIVAPVAMQKMAHPDGECAAARACASAGIAYCASQQSTTPVERIRDEGGDGVRWFQLYVLRDRDATAKLVRRAEAMGAVALVVTVDAPTLGRRERDVRNRFRLKRGLSLANVAKDDARPVAKPNAESKSTSESETVPSPSSPSGIDRRPTNASRAQSAIARRIGNRDASLTWSVVPWLRTITTLPVILKGVVTREDARLAVEAGADGVWVSNHGGRQLDGAPATLEALPEVVAGTRGRVPVIFDGGVRRGADCLKAISMGADLVAFGRPVAWGLACGGEAGVAKAAELLVEELATAMALAGTPNVDAIRRERPARRVGAPTAKL